ncbi:MAG: LD-carboxypeptidase [Candidatus Paceibacterota bacterium]|jgi:muramoyltetrapeptide carboxypeptidase LdcA involved in peptidoglycan recycling|nr:LD-carboxypeptidase [Candidatus Paceibacterota bacterium]
MNKPKRLEKGDTIALVNPAGLPPLRFRHFIPLMKQYLEKEGFFVKLYLAEETATAERLGNVFTEAWLDSEVQAVFPICGSSVIFEVLPCLYSDLLKQKKVIFCGSSVLSSLSIWLSQHAQVVTFFGPHIPFIHSCAPQRENEFTVQSFWDMIMWKKGKANNMSSVHERHNFFSVNDSNTQDIKIKNLYLRPDLIKDKQKRVALFFSLTEKVVSGKTFCITMECLLSMARLGLLPSVTNSIIFTETMDWNLEQIKNTFEELSRLDAFHGANAVFITAFTERTDRKELDFPELRDPAKVKILCSSISERIQLPVLYGFPMGHGSYKLTLPQNISCSINPEDGSVYLLERPVA